MNARDIIINLRNEGIELSASGQSLYYRAPRGVITPAILMTLKKHKMELIEVLAPNFQQYYREIDIESLAMAKTEKEWDKLKEESEGNDRLKYNALSRLRHTLGLKTKGQNDIEGWKHIVKEFLRLEQEKKL